MYEQYWSIGVTQASRLSGTRRELNSLSDHQLRDIGMTRGQIDEVSRGLLARCLSPVKRTLAKRGMSLVPLLKGYVTGSRDVPSLALQRGHL